MMSQSAQSNTGCNTVSKSVSTQIDLQKKSVSTQSVSTQSDSQLQNKSVLTQTDFLGKDIAGL